MRACLSSVWLRAQTRSLKTFQAPTYKRTYPLYKRLMMEEYDNILPRQMMYLLQAYSLSSAEWSQLRKELSKCALSVKVLHNGVFGVMAKKRAASRPLVKLLAGQTAIAFIKQDSTVASSSPITETTSTSQTSRALIEPMTVQSMLTTLKLQKKVSLLGALIDQRFHAPADVEKYSILPPVEQLHSELVSILGAGPRRLVSILGQSQQTLVQNLEQRVKDMDIAKA